MNSTAKPLNDVGAALSAEQQQDTELSLDDLEYVVGGLSRPFYADASDSSIDLANAGSGAVILPGKVAAQ